jgi:hypothetical protein
MKISSDEVKIIQTFNAKCLLSYFQRRQSVKDDRIYLLITFTTYYICCGVLEALYISKLLSLFEIPY